MGAYREVDVLKPAFQLARSIECWSVIWVRADEEIVLLIVDGGNIVFDHRPDYAVLFPARNIDRNALLRELAKLLFRGRRTSWFPEPVVDPGYKTKQIEE